jgi:hypothetical protein
VKDVDSRFEMRVDASRVGDETDSFAFEDVKVLVAENFDARFYFWCNLLIIIAACRKRA